MVDAADAPNDRFDVPNNPARIGPYLCGPGQPLLWIAGPCVLEDLSAAMHIATALKEIASRIDVNLVFKASFDKANRTSAAAFRGPGVAEGLAMLVEIRRQTGLPTTTDVHESTQASAVGEAVDLVQIPAFLARQTDLLFAAARTGKPVNVKKGQFMAPGDMRHPLTKLAEWGCQNALLTERGTFFGYGRLVSDMRAIPEMRALGAPVIFDATHSVQEPGGLGSATGGNRAMVEPLAKAALAVGADGLFTETHPDPDRSPSDGPNMIPLGEIEGVIRRLLAIRAAAQTL